MQGNTVGTNTPQLPALERISNQLNQHIPNIEMNLSSILARLNKIHFLPQIEKEENAKDTIPDDNSITFKMNQSVLKLSEIEKKTISIMDHLDKIIG